MVLQKLIENHILNNNERNIEKKKNYIYILGAKRAIYSLVNTFSLRLEFGAQTQFFKLFMQKYQC